tara:strand:- start:2167 stop:3228 length:1062 start_codon:yes stop_codon:yes gene_type:complete
MKNLKITPDVSIKIALQLIKKNGAKALVIVDKNNKLLGSLSDGDIRNAILKNISLNKKIENIFNRKPKYLIQGKYSKKNLNDLIRKNNFTIIPVIDDFKKVKEIFTLKSFSKNKTRKNNKKNILKKIPCIIMAGGKGTRLQPFTDVLPKPLIPIKKQTVIERIINNFTDYGVNKFLISINYKAEILKAYFKELKPKYKLKFITENKPLGTVGSLSKLSKKEGKYFFITNCDTISNVNLGNMYNFHIKNNYDVTLLTSSKIHQVPYGVCHVAKNGDLKNIEEKPKFDFLVNVGLYLVNNEVIDFIPKNKVFHFTDLIKILQKKKYRIGLFPVYKNNWLDVGEWDEFKKTVSFFS